MDFATILGSIQQLGGLGIVALIVYKFPNIIAAVQNLNDSSSNKLIDAHNNALAAFSDDSKRREVGERERFAAIEANITAQNNNMTALVGEVKVISSEMKSVGAALMSVTGKVDHLDARVEELARYRPGGTDGNPG